MRLRGSITIYLTLVLVLILSLLMALLESARSAGLHAESSRLAETAVESVFAEYHKQLLEEYDLFALDADYGNNAFSTENVEGRMRYFMKQNMDSQQNSVIRSIRFLEIDEAYPQILGYALLTDLQGSKYVEEACQYVKDNIPIELVNIFRSQMTQTDVDQQSEQIDDAWVQVDEASVSLKDGSGISEERNEEISDEDLAKAAMVTGDQKSIIQTVKNLKAKGVLSLLVEDPSSLSDQAVDANSLLSARGKMQGTMSLHSDTGISDKILFQYYLYDKFTSFQSASEEHALQYELEYLYGGKSRDIDNLESVAATILAMREAVNLAYLVTDTQKVEEARIIAIAIAGAFAVPALIGAIEAGVLLAWAFIDSVKDLQTLFAGGKVPFVRVAGQADSGKQIDYMTYLQLLLFAKSTDILAQRSMDLIEQNIRKKGDEQFCLDHCMIAASWQVDHHASTMFPVPLKEHHFQTEGIFQYE